MSVCVERRLTGVQDESIEVVALHCDQRKRKKLHELLMCSFHLIFLDLLNSEWVRQVVKVKELCHWKRDCVDYINLIPENVS